MPLEMLEGKFVEVIALIGPSGSGKSHHAIKVAYNTASDLIIDDGLLIQESRILAGISAKKQPTKIGAIKTALFTDREHRSEAQNTLATLMPKRVLILGTSLGMVVRITEHLNLPRPGQALDITEVASLEEIRKAKFYRTRLGKHVVPVPTLEVKRNFPNTLIDSLQVILHSGEPKKQLIFEQSVIRPNFSSLGKFTIAENVLIDITKRVLSTFEAVNHTGKIRIESEQGNTVIFVQLAANIGYPLPAVCKDIQTRVREIVEDFTGLSITAVNVTVSNLVIGKSP